LPCRGWLNIRLSDPFSIKILFAGICACQTENTKCIPGAPPEGTDEDTLQKFKDQLNDKGILTTIRTNRGLDIYAAGC